MTTDTEALAQILEAGGNKAAAFTLRSVGAVGTVLEEQLAIIEAYGKERWNAGVEASKAVADKFAQSCRESVADCPNWSVAQGEWSRARDHCVFIAEDIEALKEPECAVSTGLRKPIPRWL